MCVIATAVWVNLNKELWSTKQTIVEMTATIQELENENQELRDNLASIRALLEQKASNR